LERLQDTAGSSLAKLGILPMMRDVPAMPSGLPPLQRSVVACLASILEVDATEVPASAAKAPRAVDGLVSAPVEDSPPLAG
jgi:hypothetical protein